MGHSAGRQPHACVHSRSDKTDNQRDLPRSKKKGGGAGAPERDTKGRYKNSPEKTTLPASTPHVRTHTPSRADGKRHPAAELPSSARCGRWGAGGHHGRRRRRLCPRRRGLARRAGHHVGVDEDRAERHGEAKRTGRRARARHWEAGRPLCGRGVDGPAKNPRRSRQESPRGKAGVRVAPPGSSDTRAHTPRQRTRQQKKKKNRSETAMHRPSPPRINPSRRVPAAPPSPYRRHPLHH